MSDSLLGHLKVQEKNHRNCGALGLAKLFESAANRIAELEAQSQWISIADEMPVTGRNVQLFYKNENGKDRQVFGYYIPKFYSECSMDDSEFCEYSEEKDEYFDPEGWYETIDNWNDYTHVKMHRTPTHWMPLPAPPKEQD